MIRSYESVRCRDEGRRATLLGASGTFNGIDTVEVEKNNQTTLHVFFLNDLPDVPAALDHRPDLLSVTGGERIRHIRVVDTVKRPDHLDVLVDHAGDFSTYTLSIRLPALDPIFSSAPFSFKAGCPSPFDCPGEPSCVTAPEAEPLIDYYVKDYAGFQRALLDWVSASYPNWLERSEADLGIALLELFAHTADQLSDYQDRVANEMYLATARQRVSVKRHSALVDYQMHDGANAHALLCFQVTKDLILPAQSQIGTAAAGADAVVFETDADAPLYLNYDQFSIYTWSNVDCCLPTGATDAFLVDHQPNLQPGDYLIFQEAKSPVTGLAADADHGRRQSVQLIRTDADQDPLTGKNLTHVVWRPQDALRQDYCLTTVCADGQVLSGVSVARGNVVPASHGVTVSQTASVPVTLPVDNTLCQPPPAPVPQPFQLLLDQAPLTFTTATGDPRQGQSSVRVTVGPFGGNWSERRTLLESGPFDRNFVVDVDDDGRGTLRFGDGDYGQAVPPGAVVEASYRVGNGATGNVGADTLTQFPSTPSGIGAVTNPLPASGGVDPEPIAGVKQQAPQAFRAETLRAVTAADYARAAKKVDGVLNAAAHFRWTGSWHTVFANVQPVGQVDLSDALRQLAASQLDAYRMTGYDYELRPPTYVPLDLGIAVCVLPDHFRADVQQALLDALSARLLPDGSRGFFSSDSFTFGQPLYLSKLYAAIVAVEGVQSAQVTGFQRWGKLPGDELARGVIDVSDDEIIRLDNDPSEQEHGRLTLTMRGGK